MIYKFLDILFPLPSKRVMKTAKHKIEKADEMLQVANYCRFVTAWSSNTWDVKRIFDEVEWNSLFEID